MSVGFLLVYYTIKCSMDTVVTYTFKQLIILYLMMITPGTVILTGPVEPFANRIKMKSRDQHVN